MIMWPEKKEHRCGFGNIHPKFGKNPRVTCDCEAGGYNACRDQFMKIIVAQPNTDQNLLMWQAKYNAAIEQIKYLTECIVDRNNQIKGLKEAHHLEEKCKGISIYGEYIEKNGKIIDSKDVYVKTHAMHSCKCSNPEAARTVRVLDEGLCQCPRCGGIIVAQPSGLESK